jgi:hypothetical protein
LQARGAPLVCLFFALFCATGLMPPSIRLAWALVTLIGLRVTYPLLDVPQNALVVLIAPDMHRRGRLLVLRNIASSIAGLTVGLVAAPLLLAPGQMLAYPLWAIGAGGLAWAGAALLARSPLPPAPTPSVATGTSPHGPGFGIVLATLVVMIAASTVFRSMEPYFGAFAGGGAGMLIWAALASIVSQPVWLLLVRRLSPVRVAIVMAGVTGVAAVILLGPIRATPLGVAVTGVAFGAGSSGLWLILWYHLADHAGRGGAVADRRLHLRIEAVAGRGDDLAGDYAGAVALSHRAGRSAVAPLAGDGGRGARARRGVPRAGDRAGGQSNRCSWNSSDAAPNGPDSSGSSVAATMVVAGARRPRRAGNASSGQSIPSTIRCASGRGSRPPRMIAPQSSVKRSALKRNEKER